MSQIYKVFVLGGPICKPTTISLAVISGSSNYIFTGVKQNGYMIFIKLKMQQVWEDTQKISFFK